MLKTAYEWRSSDGSSDVCSSDLQGLPPAWDANMVLSFHKYWNRNDAASIADMVKLRDSYGRPIWLGESGENSNVWFRDAIALVEGEGIGWAFWPLTKIGLNQTIEIDPERKRTLQNARH